MRPFSIAMSVLVVASFTASPAVSANDCTNAGSQTAMNQCASEAFAAADKQLNARYQEIEKRLGNDASAKKLLTAAQRAWVSFRDAECTFSSSASAEGSVYPMLVGNCKAQLTSARTDELKNYLNCKEGDLSCPVPAAQ